MPDFSLTRNAFGRLVLTDADGAVHTDVVPIRAFPIHAPDQGVAILTQEGTELAWLDSLEQLAPDQRALVAEELASREFMPEIEHILDVSGFVTPCRWQVQTNRGDTSFLLRGEEDIRRIGENSIMIADSHGLNFLIRDTRRLDRHGRRILDRFL